LDYLLLTVTYVSRDTAHAQWKFTYKYGDFGIPRPAPSLERLKRDTSYLVHILNTKSASHCTTYCRIP